MKENVMLTVASLLSVVLGTFHLTRDLNRHGGDVTLVDLPSIGIRGNTHFSMSDLSNVEIANHLSE